MEVEVVLSSTIQIPEYSLRLTRTTTGQFVSVSHVKLFIPKCFLYFHVPFSRSRLSDSVINEASNRLDMQSQS